MSNLSQRKREEMIAFLNRLREEHTDDTSMIAINEIENFINEKKYGLVWEEHSERVDEEMVHNIPVFREVDDKKIKEDDSNDYNFLLEGDNLHSLKLLEKTHKGKIDVIYIDPPYNTGNKDFVYDDNFVVKEDGYRHSKWLSFMDKRLKIARELLSDEGVIFISIDDNEQAQLKFLCDNIFGEVNFICNIVRQAIKGGSKAQNIKTVHDYVLVYSKNINDIIEFTGYEKEEIKLDLKDEKGPYKKGRELNKWGAGSRREDSPTMWFPIQGPNGEEVYPIRNDGSEGRWRWGKSRLLKAVKENEVIFEKKDNGTYVVYEKIRGHKNKINQFTSWFADKYINAKGSEILKKIFGTMMSVFDYAKPVELISEILFMVNRKNAIVLDFFAGSGTTAHAVMDLNAKDGGNRRFILCTNNENNICEEITYPRIKKVIQGYEFKGKEETLLFQQNLNVTTLRKMNEHLSNIEKIKKERKDEFDRFRLQSKDGILTLFGVKDVEDKISGIPHNLKYYKTEFIPKLTEDEDILSDRLLSHIKEMVELENMCEIDGIKNIIILSQEELNERLSEELNKETTLYIPSYVLLSREDEKVIRDNNIEIIEIPDYYFLDELREVGEL